MENIISKLRAKNISIDVLNNQLKLKIPEGLECTELLDEVRKNKAELITFIEGLKNVNKFDSIPVAAQQKYYALSSAQKRLYFLHEFDRESLAYNMPQAAWVSGKLDSERLVNAFQMLMMRHEILRTTIEMVGDEPFQVIGDGSGFSITEYQSGAEAVAGVMESFIRPFDLKRGPLLRVGLLHVTDGTSLLMVDMHHIITDGVSHGILIRDFMSLYDAQQLPVLRLQYKDYAEWQQSGAEQTRMREQKSFWLTEYRDIPEALELPLDRQRSEQSSNKSGNYSFELNEETTAALRRLAEEQGTTLYIVLLSVYTILLSKLSNQEDIVVGTPVAGRRHADLEDMIGVFINMLAIRNFPEGRLGFQDFLRKVSSRTLSCFDHQDFQYEELVDELKLPRGTGRNPLFEATFSYENFNTEALSIPGLQFSPYAQGSGISKFDLSLFASEYAGRLQLGFSYAADLFSEVKIKCFGSYLERIVNAIILRPDILIEEIDILSEEEKYQLLNQHNRSLDAYPEEYTIISCFEKQVMLHPERVAIVDQGSELTYRSLDAMSNRLARVLQKEGVGPNSIVGLLTGRSQETIIGMLGILKAGGAYLPMDLDYPQDRINYLLEDSKAMLLLVTDADHHEIYTIKTLTVQEVIDEESVSEEAVVPVNKADDLCYVIYTSGTTGYPKGVLVEHRNVVRLFFHSSPLFDFNEADVWTMFHNPYFDFSVWEMYGALLFGGKLVIIPKMVAIDSENFLSLLVSHGVTVLNQTPSAFYNLIEAESLAGLSLDQLKLRYIIFGGESLKPLKLAGWFKKYPNTQLINMFGITETTVHVTYKLIDEQEIMGNVNNIGVPIPTLSTYIFDACQRLVPQGVSGELYVGGAGVSRGYLNRAELNELRFVQNPYRPGERLYRTGDLCRQQINGELEYIGRIDHQVNIRGYRIEPGEIENRLQEYENISDAVVMAKGEEGDKYLVAYYVAEKPISIAVIREYLQELLPDYMLPSYYVHLSSFLLTVNGKIDRRGLPEVDLSAEDHYVAARGAMEELLVSIWSDVLKLSPDRISVTRSFFDLGGHSLKAMNLVNRIRKETGSEVALKTIFSHQDIRSLSLHMSGLSGGPAYSAILPAVD
ncbi:amino acid adenylation domain-containing protein, partial [Pedobacter suwonensis]